MILPACAPCQAWKEETPPFLGRGTGREQKGRRHAAASGTAPGAACPAAVGGGMVMANSLFSCLPMPATTCLPACAACTCRYDVFCRLLQMAAPLP